MTPQEAIKRKRDLLAKLVAAAQPGSAPADPEKFIQEMQAELVAAMPERFSDANSFFRIASRVQKGEDSADATEQELYGDSIRVEAREWLREGAAAKQERFIHTYSPRKTAKLIEELYSAGAGEVIVLDPNGNAQSQTSDDLVVVLPEDSAARQPLAKIHQREMAKVWCFEPGNEAETPTGKHLVFQYT